MSRTDGRNIVTNYSYTDAENKLTDVQYPASSSINVHLHYDNYGRMDSLTDGSGSHSFTFDDRDAKLTETTTYTGLSAQTLTTAYYNDGSRSSLTLPDNTSFSWTYDGAGRTVGLTNPTSQSWSWTYSDNNWLSQQNANGQIITTPTRDARGFVTDLVNQRNDMMHTTLSDYQVSYASNMTIGSVTASVPNAPTSFSGTTSFSHDTKLQLTNETSNRGGTYNFSNTFDSAGNATNFKGSSQTFNSANQCTSWTHDGNGNPTTYHSATLAFDAENRMTSYGSLMTAGYRADGLRAWKTTSAGTTYYLYDGDQLIEEMDASGNKTAVNTWGSNGLLARSTSTRTLLYSLDASGNLSQQMQVSSGNVVATYLFDAWGARQYSSSDSAATSDPYSGYNCGAGYVTDWETGLQILGHRYYDSATGRFLTRDPIGMTGGINLYGYVRNTPLSVTDAKGYSLLSGLLGQWGAVIGACGLTLVLDFLRVIGEGHGAGSISVPNAICKALSACLASVLAAMLVTAIPGIGQCPLLGGCLAGLLASIMCQLLEWLCDMLFPPCAPLSHDEPICHIMEAIVGALAGCLLGGSEEQLHFLEAQLIAAISDMVGSDMEESCRYAR